MADRSDALKRNLKRYLDSGAALSASFSKMSRADLEHALRELAHPGSDARQRVEDAIEELRGRSVRGAEQLVDLVRNEVQREFEVVVSKRREDLADLADRVTRMVGAVVRHSSTPTEAAPPKASATKRPAAKGASKRASESTTAKKAPAKKTTPSKAAAKVTPAKRAAAKATPAKKAAAAKTPAAKKTPAVKKKTPAVKQSAAKNSAAKKASTTTASASKTGASKASAAPRKRPSQSTPA